MLGIPVVGGSVVGVQFNGPLKFLFRSLSVPILILGNQGQRRVRFRQVFVKLQGP